MSKPATVLITGPTRNLGRHAMLAMAQRPREQRPDLLLVGRAGPDLTAAADEARSHGATVREIGCDLSRLSDVRAAAATVRDLLGSFSAPARIVLLGSNTYHANFWRKLLHVPAAEWADPVELARPAAGEQRPSMAASGVAYSNSKLAILYYAHELQRRAGAGINISVFEPGWMPGTALSRGAPEVAQAMGRALGRVPGVSTPQRSGPPLAAIALDEKWAHLRDGAFVVKTKLTQVQPVAHDRGRERRLWEATAELLKPANAPH